MRQYPAGERPAPGLQEPPLPLQPRPRPLRAVGSGAQQHGHRPEDVQHSEGVQAGPHSAEQPTAGSSSCTPQEL